ncbi:bifunctional hydroxymethylpyrimidine kinase/phosphomethylpyrimidine kinase [Enterococcus faecalis]
MTKKILTIGGSDPFSGGGIQTDLKTFENFRLFGLSALTCIATAQGNQFQVHNLSAKLLESQLASLPKASLAGVKIGLIHNIQSISVIRSFLIKQPDLPIVLDPVFVFKESASRYEKEYIAALSNELFPLATVITPNLKEAELLTKRQLTTIDDVQAGAEQLYEMGASSVVIKGGNRLAGDKAVDNFYDGKRHRLYSKPKQQVKTINGAGCGFSSAIAAGLVLGEELTSAITNAKQYISESITSGVTIDSEFGSVWYGGKMMEIEEGEPK